MRRNMGTKWASIQPNWTPAWGSKALFKKPGFIWFPVNFKGIPFCFIALFQNPKIRKNGNARKRKTPNYAIFWG